MSYYRTERKLIDINVGEIVYGGFMEMDPEYAAKFGTDVTEVEALPIDPATGRTVEVVRVVVPVLQTLKGAPPKTAPPVRTKGAGKGAAIDTGEQTGTGSVPGDPENTEVSGAPGDPAVPGDPAAPGDQAPPADAAPVGDEASAPGAPNVPKL